MKAVVNVTLAVAAISLILGIISRLTVTPLPLAPGRGIEAQAFLDFTNTCLLIAIALMVKAKQ